MPYYKMSLLPNSTYARPGVPLYATTSGGGTGNPAPQFVATGIAESGGFVSTGAGGNVTLKQGVFETTAVIDPLTNNVDVMRIKSAAGLNRWEVGISGSEDGGNLGSDLFIRPSSDAGSALSTALAILRDTGDVIVSSGNLICNGTGATIGALGDVGGGVLNIRGDTGLGRVYDPVYNPVPPLSNFLVNLSSAIQNGTPAAGSTLVPMGSFTVPATGLYLLSAQTLVNVGIGAGNDIVVGVSDFCSVGLTTSPATPGLATASATLVSPFSMTYTDNTPGGVDYVVTATNALVLTAGVTYIIQAEVYSGITGTLRFPATVGQTGVQFNCRIIPLLANTP